MECFLFPFQSNRRKKQSPPRTSAHFSGGHVSISNWNDNDVPLPFGIAGVIFTNRFISPVSVASFSTVLPSYAYSLFSRYLSVPTEPTFDEIIANGYYAHYWQTDDRTRISPHSSLWKRHAFERTGFIGFRDNLTCHERLYEINHSQILLCFVSDPRTSSAM